MTLKQEANWVPGSNKAVSGERLVINMVRDRTRLEEVTSLIDAPSLGIIDWDDLRR